MTVAQGGTLTTHWGSPMWKMASSNSVYIGLMAKRKSAMNLPLFMRELSTGVTTPSCKVGQEYKFKVAGIYGDEVELEPVMGEKEKEMPMEDGMSDAEKRMEAMAE